MVVSLRNLVIWKSVRDFDCHFSDYGWPNATAWTVASSAVENAQERLSGTAANDEILTWTSAGLDRQRSWIRARQRLLWL
jgi:hypothetical protein